MSEEKAINKKIRYYSLYVNKKDIVLKITLMQEGQPLYQHAKELLGEKSAMVRFNDCYMFSNDRKLLKEYALDLKKSWEEEYTRKLNAIRSLKIFST
jgi:hypothetical protein